MFGTIVGVTPDGMIASHLPFMFDDARGAHGTLISHMARANPHASLLNTVQEMLVIFVGANGYISPSWFPERASAPAWDYAAVHCYGKAVIQSEQESVRNINDLVMLMEEERPQGWSAVELGEGGMERLMPRIICFEIEVTRLEAKFKVGQGEHPANTQAAILRLESEGQAELAAYMREYNPVQDDRVTPS
jgi:transcriptional regulator